MVAALLLPRLLEKLSDRTVMASAASGLVVALLAILGLTVTPGIDRWVALLVIWPLLGIGYSAILTPSGRLLKRSASVADRSALFAAQFALSHGCWLITYAVAGPLGAAIGMPATLGLLAGLALVGLVVALCVWPRHDPESVRHSHHDLAADHPHLKGGAAAGKVEHEHPLVIDALHARWPRP